MQNLLSSRLLSKNLKIKTYRTIILSVVLYGCGTWSLTLREELRVRVFENRVLRRMFVPKRDEVTGEWRKLYNEELNDLFWGGGGPTAPQWAMASSFKRFLDHTRRTTVSRNPLGE